MRCIIIILIMCITVKHTTGSPLHHSLE